jgi:predicted 3-demethylubiquinone-9 3-methyltransferase (glyoxalase superfamily)
MTMQQKIAPCLWFEKEAEEAASFYTSIFPDSYIEYAATAGLGKRRVHAMTSSRKLTSMMV